MATIFERLNKGRPLRQPTTNDAELARDVQKLHEWLQHKGEPAISLREICRRGPRALRHRKQAINAVEILIGNGWLVPIRAHRHDKCLWRVVRAHSEYPTMATMATTASMMTPRAPQPNS